MKCCKLKFPNSPLHGTLQCLDDDNSGRVFVLPPHPTLLLLHLESKCQDQMAYAGLACGSQDYKPGLGRGFGGPLTSLGVDILDLAARVCGCGARGWQFESPPGLLERDWI